MKLSEMSIKELQEVAVKLGVEEAGVIRYKDALIVLIRTQKKRLQEINELKAAVVKSSNSVGTKEFKESYQNKLEITREKIEAEEKIESFIPLDHGEKKGKAFLPVTVNGYKMIFKKGVTQKFPKSVWETLIKPSLNLESEVADRFNLDKRSQDDRDKLNY